MSSCTDSIIYAPANFSVKASSAPVGTSDSVKATKAAKAFRSLSLVIQNDHSHECAEELLPHSAISYRTKRLSADNVIFMPSTKTLPHLPSLIRSPSGLYLPVSPPLGQSALFPRASVFPSRHSPLTPRTPRTPRLSDLEKVEECSEDFDEAADINTQETPTTATTLTTPNIVDILTTLETSNDL